VPEGSRVRLSIVGVIVIALFSALFARLWFLQVAEGGVHAEAATTSGVRVVREPAVRGRILDAKGRVLVGNRVAEAITLDRNAQLTRRKRTVVIGRLAELLGVSTGSIEDRIQDPRLSPFAPVPVAVDVPLEKITYIREHQEEFPAVAAELLTVREYPHGTLGAHVLGYVGEINAEELEALKDEGYRQGDEIGKGGVEQMFESELRGEPRIQKLEVDSRGRVVRELDDRPAVPGRDVQLTIDLDAQRVAEESLAQGMGAAQGVQDVSDRTRYSTFQAQGGAVIVLDPRDGSVVAMASAPTFDPSAFTNGIPSEVFAEFNREESNYPLLNRAVQGQYAPGSTFKLVTAIAGLESNLITPEASIYDNGCLQVSDREFCNAGEIEHGTVDLPRALTVSSDVYFYEIGRDLWQFYDPDDPGMGYATQETARRYGFGAPTGIGLAEEAVGRIPDQQFKEDFNATNPDLEQKRVNSLWLPGDSVNLAVGQGDLLVTPIQLATAYAAFANGGTRHTPRLASVLLEPGTGSEGEAPPEVVRELPTQPVGKTGLEPEVRAPIMAGLIGAVSNGNGTAVAAFEGFRPASVAGKTGTAEVNDKQDTSLFVGITPPDAPQYVTVAIVEEGGFGSAVAAPIVRRVIEALSGNANPDPVVLRPPSENNGD
jgi:penicillin-binding protein 2